VLFVVRRKGVLVASGLALLTLLAVVVVTGQSGAESKTMKNIVRGFFIVFGVLAGLALLTSACWVLWCLACGAMEFSSRIIGTLAVFAVPAVLVVGILWVIGWIFRRR